jgi:hypothetical protein
MNLRGKQQGTGSHFAGLVIALFTAALCMIACDAAAELQVGPYAGIALSPKVSGVHGDHITSGFRFVDTPVDGVEIDQDMVLGVNGRYLFNNYFGIDFDIMYSPVEFPEQSVLLGGDPIDQPKASLEYYTLSAGPFARYRGDGIWRTINPYVCAAASLLTGSASDVNLWPVYGHGGGAALEGTGFNLRAGASCTWERFGVAVEYRYDRATAEISRFRSFISGVNLTVESSALILCGFLIF